MVTECAHPPEQSCFICETRSRVDVKAILADPGRRGELVRGAAEFITGIHGVCPECMTTLDEDGYCTSPGCTNCGKTPA